MAILTTLRFIIRSTSSSTAGTVLRRSSSSSSSFAFGLFFSPPQPLSTFSSAFPSHALSPGGSSSFALRLTSSRSRLFSPLCGLPLSVGPLFLSSPAWQLSQLATPLYLQGEDVKYGRGLLAQSGFASSLGVGSSGFVGGGLLRDGVRWGESSAVVRDAADDSILNFPNLISISRMVSGPLIGWMIINEWYLTSFVALAISGMTDWLDGFVARRMNINSVLGSYLDPLADKVLIGCVALAMVKKDLLHSGLVLLVVLRDVGLIGGAVYKRGSSLQWEWKSWSDFISLNTSRPEKVEPLYISKVNTVFQLTLVASALLQPEFGTEETQLYITYLSWLVASTTVASSVAYGVQHLCSTATRVSARTQSR